MGSKQFESQRDSHYADTILNNNLEFPVDLVFPTSESLKLAIKEYAVKDHKAMKVVKNEKKRIRAKCKDGCPWTLYAAATVDGFSYKRGLNNAIVDVVHVDVTKWQFYRAREVSRNIIEGSVREQYYMLRDYCEEIRAKNPRSSVILKCNSEIEGYNKLQRIYIFLDACKKGFMSGCKPIIGLDACFVKGYHKGQLLVAMGTDADNAIYLITFVVLESECYDSWRYIMKRIEAKSSSILSWKNPVGKSVWKIIEENKKQSINCRLIDYAGDLAFGVQH
ncbi:uncharacterized protein LOC112093826 [Morus notabilis]|uniref:uncharacterized protein LOC112093826 n=1 Tax=Morus notabilis TaxID=981085 RepID=UPI000CED112E|nr:uncharacterized protein LOC112093826 [Morus notabilis]